MLDFQWIGFIRYLLAVSERWRKNQKHFRCHYCIEGCEFEASKWLWKLSAIFTLSCWQVLLICLLKFDKELAKSGSKWRIHQQTPYLKLPWICSVNACSWCWRNVQNMKKIFALKVTCGSSWRKWIVACIVSWPQTPVRWNTTVCLTWAQVDKTVHGAWLWVGRSAEWVNIFHCHNVTPLTGANINIISVALCFSLQVYCFSYPLFFCMVFFKNTLSSYKMRHFVNWEALF